MEDLRLYIEQLSIVTKLTHYKRKTILLREGVQSDKVFIIKDGALRSWFNDDGNDITFQFFFEGDVVSSFESLKNNLPSLYNIETITPVTLQLISKKALYLALEKNPILNEKINLHITKRLYHYQQLFISRIKNSPQRRYEELLQQQPEIFTRVPHHYIATFLGITPVSLSRIRAKKNIAS